MRKTALKAFFALTCLSTAPSFAASAQEVAKTFMTELVEISQHSKQSQGSTSEEAKAKIRKLSEKVDYEALAKKSFGPRWAKFKASERKAFLDTFQQLLEVVLYPKAGKITAKPDAITVTSAPKQPNAAKVVSEIEREKRGELVREQLEILLYVDPKSSKIVDAVIEGELLSKNLNRQFTNALQKKTFAQIIDQMKKSVDDARKKTA